MEQINPKSCCDGDGEEALAQPFGKTPDSVPLLTSLHVNLPGSRLTLFTLYFEKLVLTFGMSCSDLLGPKLC